MKEVILVIKHPAGLHARPAARFVQMANQFGCEIKVSKSDKTVDAKSILGVLTLAVNQGNTIKITAKGEGEEEAIATIQNLVENDLKD